MCKSTYSRALNISLQSYTPQIREAISCYAVPSTETLLFA